MITPVTTGTATFTNGSDLIAGQGTDWAISLRNGGSIERDGEAARYIIREVISNTSIRIWGNYLGSTGAEVAYRGYPLTDSTADNIEAVQLLRDLARQLKAGAQFRFDVAGTLAARSAYDTRPEGFRYAAWTDSEGETLTSWALYVRDDAEAGGWSPEYRVTGEKGDKGDPGFTPGLSYAFSDLTAGTPAEGVLRFDNADPASATELVINVTDRHGADRTAEIALLTLSTNAGLRSFLRIYKAGAEGTVYAYKVTGAATGSGATRTLPIAATGAAAGTIADANNVVLTYSLAGAPGMDGRTILTGSGAPSNGLGSDGDLYYDTSGVKLHGPKASGVWPAGVNLVGVQGPAGVQPGARLVFSSSIDMNTDPGNGKFRFDAEVWSEVEEISIDLVDADSASLTATLDRMVASLSSGIKSVVNLCRVSDRTIQREFSVLSEITPAPSGYRKFNIEPGMTLGAWANDQEFILTDRPSGEPPAATALLSVNGLAPDGGGNVDILRQGFRLDVTNTPSIPNATETAITFNTETLDDFDLVTVSTSQVVFAEAGTWLFAGYAQGTSMTVTYLRIGIYNASDVLQASFLMPSNTAYTGVFGAGPVAVEAGWKVRLMLRHDSGGARNLIANTTFLQGYKIA
jgi:hypothetical protein